MKKLLALCLVLAAVLAAACAAAEPFATESGVTFGMTEPEIRHIESGYGREPDETTETTYFLSLPYSRGIRFDTVECEALYYSLDMADHRLFQLFYVSRGEDDYSSIRDLLAARYGNPVNDPENEGRYSIAFEQGGRFKAEECIHWIASGGDDPLGIDLWRSRDGDVYTVFYDPSSPASSGQVVKTYSDETGISFPHVPGWEEWPVRLTSVNLCLCLLGDTRTNLLYSHSDLRDLPSFQEYAAEKELDFLDEVLLPRFGETHEIRNLRTEIHHGTEYRVFDYRPADQDGAPGRTAYFAAVTIRNGYTHEFRLVTDKEPEPLLPDFEALLDSVTFEK